MIVILHGWSDSASSFERLARSLREMGLSREIHHIRLAEYITMDDDVTFDDLAHAMERAWTRDGLPQKPRSVDMIVHSTGGLVGRHWLTRLKTPDTHPLRRLLMLAPANFGSPLAHKGRSFLGRVFKGFRSDRPFHTGAQLLKGLDLASPFAWELARRDCFGGDPWYGKDGILVTVLVGSSGYSGIQAAANSPGSDGTVLVSSANLQPVHVRMDFASDPDRPTIVFRQANATTAFCRIPGDNHSTLAWKDRGPRNGIVADLVKRALTVTPDAFMEHVRFCNRLSGEHRAADRQDSIAAYQHTVLYVVDDHGTPVEDYFIELFAKRQDLPAGGSRRYEPDDALTAKIQREVLVHAHKPDFAGAMRALRIDCDALDRLLLEPGRDLYVSLTALPDIGKTGTVGYRTLAYDAIGSIRLDRDRMAALFQPDRTALVELHIKRYGSDRLMRFHVARE